MKKILSMAMLATFLTAIPVLGVGLGTAPEETRAAQTNMVPMFAQVSIRIGSRRRRHRRRVVARRVYRRSAMRYRRHWRRRH